MNRPMGNDQTPNQAGKCHTNSQQGKNIVRGAEINNDTKYGGNQQQKKKHRHQVVRFTIIPFEKQKSNYFKLTYNNC